MQPILKICIMTCLFASVVVSVSWPDDVIDHDKHVILVRCIEKYPVSYPYSDKS